MFTSQLLSRVFHVEEKEKQNIATTVIVTIVSGPVYSITFVKLRLSTTLLLLRTLLQQRTMMTTTIMTTIIEVTPTTITVTITKAEAKAKRELYRTNDAMMVCLHHHFYLAKFPQR